MVPMSNGVPHITHVDTDNSAESLAAAERLTEILSYESADADNAKTYITFRATCVKPSCRGWHGCDNCRHGESEHDLVGAPAQAAYEAWAAADNDDYSIASGYHLGSLTKSATGWATFLPMAAAFMAKHGPCSMSNDSTNDGEPGSGMLSWQTEMVEWMASEIRSAKAVAA